MLQKHPLFWKEWKNARWWSVLMTGIFLIMFLSLNHYLEGNRQYLIKFADNMAGADIKGNSYFLERPIFFTVFYRTFGNASMFLIPIIIVMSILLFHSDRNENIGAFISSLPFKKKEQFKIKWIVGALAITIPFVITFILTLMIRAANWSWINEYYQIYNFNPGAVTDDTLMAVMCYILQAYIFILAFYSFIMFIQTIVGNHIAGGVIGCITPLVPWFLLEGGTSTLAHILGDSVRFNVRHILNNYDRWLSFYQLLSIRRVSSYSPDSMTGYSVVYPQFLLEITMLLLLMVVSIFAGTISYGKNENSRNGYIAMFPWVERVLVIGVTICSAILGNIVLRGLVRKTNSIYEIITLAVSGIIGYMIIQKMMEIFGGVKND